MNIPIVVLAYDRVHCLQRLLSSLSKVVYLDKVRLVISIDGGGSTDVVEFAKSFPWIHGEKEVILRENNLGIRRHVMACAALSKTYDGVVVLEDDIYVAPHFYEYTVATQHFYANEARVAGVALYSHLYNETAWLPFMPINDGYDVYFMRLACSWGQSWLASQWSEFEKWYKLNHHRNLSKDLALPSDVLLWPDSSWKKYYIKYLIETDRYFVYPRVSYSTNFGDIGENHKGTKKFQVPLSFGKNALRLPSFEESRAHYDSFCELEVDCLKRYKPEWSYYDLSVDFYGMKHKDRINSDYVITRQQCEKPIRTYGLEIKPHEANVIEDIPGDKLYLVESRNLKPYDKFLSHRLKIYADNKFIQPYYYALTESHFYFLTEKIRKLTSGEILKTELQEDVTTSSALKKLIIKIRNGLNQIISAL